jgi:DNA-binding beta-propeller fold protein YncE
MEAYQYNWQKSKRGKHPIMDRILKYHIISGLLCLLLGFASIATAEFMIVGNDEKVVFKQTGATVTAPGRDTVSIIDIGTNPEEPKIIHNLSLMNSIYGPPTNLAITPNEKLAIVACSMDYVRKGEAWEAVPDNKLYIIDLTVTPPAHIDTIEVDKQPSGLAINPAGDLVLVANRAGKSISVLSIEGKTVKLIDTIAMDEKIADVAITPDGKRALAAKRPGHKIALLEIDGRKVTYNNYDMTVGPLPYNVKITPDGKMALAACCSISDGNVDTVSVIDLEEQPPRVIDHVMVGDSPEGLAISPTGKIAVAVLIKGSGPHYANKWFYNRNGSIAVLEIGGKHIRKIDEVEVRGLPEGAVFSPDGSYLYIGNYVDRDISILKVEGTKVTNTGKLLKLPGQPASMRGKNP